MGSVYVKIDASGRRIYGHWSEEELAKLQSAIARGPNAVRKCAKELGRGLYGVRAKAAHLRFIGTFGEKEFSKPKRRKSQFLPRKEGAAPVAEPSFIRPIPLNRLMAGR